VPTVYTGVFLVKLVPITEFVFLKARDIDLMGFKVGAEDVIHWNLVLELGGSEFGRDSAKSSDIPCKYF
jgi:hypothetical protein